MRELGWVARRWTLCKPAILWEDTVLRMDWGESRAFAECRSRPSVFEPSIDQAPMEGLARAGEWVWADCAGDLDAQAIATRPLLGSGCLDPDRDLSLIRWLARDGAEGYGVLAIILGGRRGCGPSNGRDCCWGNRRNATSATGRPG